MILPAKDTSLMKNRNEILFILNKLLQKAEQEHYAGYDKFDGLNSPFLKKISFNNKMLKFLLQQIVKECPFNLRPVLGIKKEKNPKGLALFGLAYLNLFLLTRDEIYLNKFSAISDWFIENNHCADSNFLGFGYNFEWQTYGIAKKKNSPNAVVSVFVGEMYLKAFEVTDNQEYLEYAKRVANFLVEKLHKTTTQNGTIAFSYFEEEIPAIVINVQALIGAFLIKLWKYSNQKDYRKIATGLFQLIDLNKTDYYAWYYTIPKDKSHITHDNYHTGYVLDGFFDYLKTTEDHEFLQTYLNGLKFYQDNLFLPSGAPKWMWDKPYPHDIHGSAQGILTFSKAAQFDTTYHKQAEKVLHWTIGNLYRPKESDFIYRKGRLMKWNVSYMRWCNGWMAYALSEYLISNFQE